MKCGQCSRLLQRGENKCSKCGWMKATGGQISEWGQEYNDLPLCERCSSTGFLLGPEQLVAPALKRESDRGSVRVRLLEYCDKTERIPVHPFQRKQWLCSCPRGRKRQELRQWRYMDILTPGLQRELEQQAVEDMAWWVEERSRRGLVVRKLPRSERMQELLRVLEAEPEEIPF